MRLRAGTGLILAFLLAGCSVSASSRVSSIEESSMHSTSESVLESNLSMKVDGIQVDVQWEKNQSIEALNDLVGSDGLSLSMERYGGFEQVGILPRAITSNDSQMSTNPGDIVLYSGNSLVVFFGHNSWSYTKFGWINGLTDDELSKLLNKERVIVSLTQQND